MNRKIMQFSNERFYEGKLRADSSVADHTLADLGLDSGKLEDSKEPIAGALSPDRPVVFLDTADLDGGERQRQGSTSRENRTESEIVAKVASPLLDSLEPREIGVISPYDDQVDLLQSRLGQEELEIKTVDGFQGREKEVIIISFVRSNPENQLGFLTDVRRLNVSLTRARRKLIMVGDSNTLSSHKTYNNLLEFVQNHGSFLSLSKASRDLPADWR